MNKKVKTTVLLILVFSIWGLIAYNIYSYKNPTVMTNTHLPKEREVTTELNVKKRPLEINNYRDPFLGKIMKSNPQKTNKKIINEIVFPPIVYHGIIKGDKINSYIISVNNKQEVFKIGLSLYKIKLISANSKEIIVRFKGVQKRIKKIE